jgi:hypothetical protein
MYPEDLIVQGADALGVEPAAVKAVIEVESSGEPFLPEGAVTPLGADVSLFPTVQFEGHVFWKLLVETKDPHLSPGHIMTCPEQFADPSGQPVKAERIASVLYPKRTKKYTLRPLPEWDQLLLARCIDEGLADQSASWGCFQIMGFNYSCCGEPDVGSFVRSMHTLEGQNRLFINFIRRYAGGALLKALKTRSFMAFARTYNGPGYKENKYDVKLEAAYARFSKQK